MKDTKTKFIDSTAQLIEVQGYHATGLNQIILESGAPKGSLYYHFPGGKEELVSAAVQQAGDNLVALIQKNVDESKPAAESIRDFVLGVAHGVEVTNYQSGGPLTAVAMETATTSEPLNLACRAAFSRIQEAFTEKLIASGLSQSRAGQLALFITVSIEGGIILSRTNHSGDPLRQVAEQLYRMLNETRYE
jgi:TetR/AcrR family transcriptional repressor of lmrAB and yxaGH operons